MASVCQRGVPPPAVSAGRGSVGGMKAARKMNHEPTPREAGTVHTPRSSWETKLVCDLPAGAHPPPLNSRHRLSPSMKEKDSTAGPLTKGRSWVFHAAFFPPKEAWPGLQPSISGGLESGAQPSPLPC